VKSGVQVKTISGIKEIKEFWKKAELWIVEYS
jgi:hypothetical protein